MAEVQPIPSGYHTVTPILCVKGAQEALEFYKRAFAAEERFKMNGPDGKLVHAEIQIGNSVLMLAELRRGEPTRASLYIYAEDCDSLFNRAVAAGATKKVEPNDAFWGDRFGEVSDPFGNTWSIATHKEDLSQQEIVSRAKALFEKDERVGSQT